MDATPRRIVLVGLLALAPGATYLLATGQVVAAIALLNVALVVASLRLATAPSAGDHPG